MNVDVEAPNLMLQGINQDGQPDGQQQQIDEDLNRRIRTLTQQLLFEKSEKKALRLLIDGLPPLAPGERVVRLFAGHLPDNFPMLHEFTAEDLKSLVEHCSASPRLQLRYGNPRPEDGQLHLLGVDPVDGQHYWCSQADFQAINLEPGKTRHEKMMALVYCTLAPNIVPLMSVAGGKGNLGFKWIRLIPALLHLIEGINFRVLVRPEIDPTIGHPRFEAVLGSSFSTIRYRVLAVPRRNNQV